MSDRDPNQAGRYESEEAGLVAAQCCYCRRARAGAPGCDAFPAGIPDEFLTNAADHRRPHPGDRGVRFEPRADVPAATLAALRRTLDALA